VSHVEPDYRLAAWPKAVTARAGLGRCFVADLLWVRPRSSRVFAGLATAVTSCKDYS
jgi:hypothetical protein